MSPVSLSLRRPLTVVILIIALILGAGVALQRMPRDVFPPLGIPTIYVAQPYGGMDPAQMEGWLTFYYEYHFLYITGIEHVESKSIQGASIMKLQFHPGTDMAAAMSETVAYVNRARAFMPPGTPGPFITRFDAGSVPVGNLVFSTENPARTVAQMQDAALNQVRPLFATLPGVSAPPPFGGSARTILVNVKPDRMRAYGLSPDEIVQAMTQANVIGPSGNMQLGDKYPIVPTNAVVKNIQELAGVPLRTTTEGSVFLRDVATVEDGADLVTSYALVNGRRTVYIPVTKRSDASTLAVVKLVRDNLPVFQSAVPDDVKVTYEFDQSPIVLRSIHDLLKEGAIGAALTGLMVLLFLRDWRSVFIVVVNIPLSLLAAVFAMWVSGQTVNLMTLGGLALAVGILVDEATVAVENIHTHLARGRSAAWAALDAIRETALPRLLAMLCVVAVFIPAFFMEGAARALFVPLAVAVAFSMFASYLFSSTLVPILTVWLLRGKKLAHGTEEMGWLKNLYTAILKPLVTLRWLLVPAYVAACVAVVWFIGGRLGTEIFPSAESGQFALRLRAPAGTKVESTEAIAKQVLEIIKREAGPDNVALTMGLVGVHAPNYPVNLIYLWNGGPEEGQLSVQLKPGAPVVIETLKERLRAAFAKELPEVRFSFEPSDLVSRVMSFGSPTPIEVAVSGPDLAVNREHATKIFERLRNLPSLRDVQIAQELDFPTVDVNIDRERAGLLGVRVSDMTRSLVAATTSSRFTVPNYWADTKTGVSYSLQVQIPQTLTQTLEDVKNVPVGAKDGGSVLLRNVASITPGSAVGQYERYNMARVVSVTANLHGAALGEVAQEVEKALAEIGASPPKTKTTLRGQVVPLKSLLGGLQNGLLLAIVAIFLMLAANFQSLRLALVVISSAPAVIAGVALALWLTGTTLNIQSFMGAIMAIGVAVANAILLITFAERSRLDGRTAREAALEGARSRLRPILMTSCAMIAGMVPMAMGLGDGGEQTAPLGRAVIGGLAAATLATLFILPSVFALLRDRASTRSRSLDPTDPLSGHFVLPVGHA
jgi:multidrug efflux pump subunit AcrB